VRFFHYYAHKKVGFDDKRSIMKSAEYMYCSMFGSYWLDCEVLESLDDDKFKIRFYNDFIEEYETVEVDGDRLQFSQV